MLRRFLLRSLAVLAFGGFVAGLWAFQVRENARLRSPALSSLTASDRRAALAALRAAWARRPVERNLQNARDQVEFINHTAFFTQTTHKDEIGVEMVTFYHRCVRDFFARYGSEDYLDGNSD